MKKVLICAMMSVFMLSGCSMFSANEDVISVNNKVIKRGVVEKAINEEIDNSMFKAFGGAANFVKSDENLMYLAFKEKAVKELIIKTLITSEVEKRGITVSEEEIKDELKSVIDRVGSKDELNSLLKRDGVSNAEFMEGLKNQVEIKKLVDSIKPVKISDSDIQKYYNQNIDKFKRPEQVRASHILVSADLLKVIRELKAKNKNLSPEDLNKEVEKVMAERKAKAESILKKVQADPESFAKIARKESDDKVSAERGGELGYFAKEGQMVPEFSTAAFAMKPNTVSNDLVKTKFGYHIIKVTDRREAGTLPFVKVKGQIKFYLENQERVAVLKNLTDSLIKTAEIKYIDKSYDTSKVFGESIKTESKPDTSEQKN